MKRISETKIHTMTQCALFAALLCICSPVALPIGPVPITLSLFAVMLVGPLVSWIGSFFVYGFGELIENTTVIAELAAKADAEKNNAE